MSSTSIVIPGGTHTSVMFRDEKPLSDLHEKGVEKSPPPPKQDEGTP